MSSKTFVRLIIILGVLLVLNVVVWGAVLNAKAPAQTPATTAPATATPILAPTSTPRPAAAPAATAAATATAGASRVLTTLDQVAQAVQNGQHGAPFRLTFSQQEVSQDITTYLADNPNSTFSDIQVSLQPGQAIINGKAQVSGLSLPFTAVTTVAVVNHQPQLKIVSLTMLGAAVPGFVRDQISSMIEQNANLPLTNNIPVSIDQVEIQQGQAVVTGTVP